MSTSAPMTFIVAIDWDNDGSFATTGDDISAYVHEVSVETGIKSDLLTDRIAQVGQCVLRLNNSDRTFSPLNSAGAYYGKLLPDRPVRVQITDGVTTWPLFRGYTQTITPEGGGRDVHGAIEGFICEIACIDEMSRIQNERIALPLQQDITAGTLIRHIINQALAAPVATNTITFTANPANNNTITIGDGTTSTALTWKTTLTGSQNEILIGSTIIDSATNLAALINRASGSGSLYSGVLTLPQLVSADRNRNLSYDTTNQDSDVLLRFNVSTKDKLAQRFYFADVAFIDQARLYLKKVGSPTGTLTVRIETDADTGPSGTLVHANATATVAESTLSTSYGLITFTFPDTAQLPLNTNLWIVLSTDRAASGTNYVAWGADGSSPSFAQGEMRSQASGVWTNESKDACFDFGANVITLSSQVRGAMGNAYTLSTTGSWATLGGATFSGGADYPTATPPDLDAGVQVFDYACDDWSTSDTNGMTALKQAVDSEHGMLWIGRDGVITFRDHNYLFLLPATAASLSIDNDHSGLSGDLSVGDTYNRVEVLYTPLTTLSNGVIATAKSVIAVPGLTGLTERYNPSQPIRVAAGDTVAKLPFADSTGNKIGALSVTLPLVATTDFTINEDPSGTSVDYTNLGFVTFSVAINGSNAEVALKNTALGPLFITKLQIRGVGLARYNQSSAVSEVDLNAGEARRTLTLNLPIASGSTFAQALADYYLDRYSTAAYRVRSITFGQQNVVNDVNLFSLDIGDLIVLTDAQSGVSDQNYVITGMSYSGITQRSTGDIVFHVFRVDDSVYGQWDSTDPTLGDWDTAKWSL